jgi:hypothetical protein
MTLNDEDIPDIQNSLHAPNQLKDIYISETAKIDEMTIYDDVYENGHEGIKGR